jgi:hypothetical protein
MHQKPQFCQRECVKKGQIPTNDATIVGGELSLRKKIVAYMPWE